jgi:hypothetical protein
MPVFRTVSDAQSGEIKLEAIHQPLYDSAEVSAAGELSFFQNPAGRSEFLTNVKTAGQLSWPKRFSIKAIRQVPAFTAVLTDLQSYFSDSLLKIDVGEKNYLTVPAFMISAGVGLEAQLLTGNAAPVNPGNGETYATVGRPEQRNIYSLIHSIYIPPVQNFAVRIIVGTGAAPAAAFRLHIFLEGELLREIQ